MKRGTSKFPPSELRIKTEDLMAESTIDTSPTGKGILEDSEVVDMTFTQLDNYQENVEIRNKQF